MSIPGDVHTHEYRTMRATLKTEWQARNTPCGICGQATIQYDAPPNQPDSFELDHTISRHKLKALGRTDLLLDPNNATPSHHRCNRAKQAGNAPPPTGETSEDW